MNSFYSHPVPDLLRGTGATYRQIDYWVRRGLLRPTNPLPGSGVTREWSADEIAVASRIVELLAAGLTLEAAHHAARNGGWLPGNRLRVEHPLLPVLVARS